jgi:hypothetical protein
MSSDRRLAVFGEQIVEGFDKEGLQRDLENSPSYVASMLHGAADAR